MRYRPPPRPWDALSDAGLSVIPALPHAPATACALQAGHHEMPAQLVQMGCHAGRARAGPRGLARSATGCAWGPASRAPIVRATHTPQGGSINPPHLDLWQGLHERHASSMRALVGPRGLSGPHTRGPQRCLMRGSNRRLTHATQHWALARASSPSVPASLSLACPLRLFQSRWSSHERPRRCTTQ